MAHQELIPEVKRLITEVDAAPDLSRRQVERLIGVPLGQSPDAPDDPHELEARLPSGPFEKVEFREPSPQQTQGRFVLAFRVRDGIELPLAAFDKELLGPVSDINPRIPPEGTVTRTLAGEGRATHLQFRSKSDLLRSLVFQRDANKG